MSMHKWTAHEVICLVLDYTKYHPYLSKANAAIAGETPTSAHIAEIVLSNIANVPALVTEYGKEATGIIDYMNNLPESEDDYITSCKAAVKSDKPLSFIPFLCAIPNTVKNRLAKVIDYSKVPNKLHTLAIGDKISKRCEIFQVNTFREYRTIYVIEPDMQNLIMFYNKQDIKLNVGDLHTISGRVSRHYDNSLPQPNHCRISVLSRAKIS